MHTAALVRSVAAHSLVLKGVQTSHSDAQIVPVHDVHGLHALPVMQVPVAFCTIQSYATLTQYCSMFRDMSGQSLAWHIENQQVVMLKMMNNELCCLAAVLSCNAEGASYNSTTPQPVCCALPVTAPESRLACLGSSLLTRVMSHEAVHC